MDIGETTTRLGRTKVAQAEWGEQGWRWRVERHRLAALLLCALCEPAVHLSHEGGISYPEIVVGNPQASGQEIEGELDRLQVHVPLGVLEPLQAHLGRALETLDGGAPFSLISGEGLRYAPVPVQRPCQRDRVLHGELGSGAD